MLSMLIVSIDQQDQLRPADQNQAKPSNKVWHGMMACECVSAPLEP